MENNPESQCGFRSNKGSADMIFMLGQIQEKCREHNRGLYATFVNLPKAFYFHISNGTKQGCVLVPTLVLIFFGIMLREAEEDNPDCIYVCFWTDGSLFTYGVSSHTRNY